jgi:GT2 family glycosyltransferase
VTNSQTPSIVRRIAALATCFNRRELTLASLRSLFSQRGVDGVDLLVYLLDDSSRDGTPEAVSAMFPQVRLLHGDGSLYWNRGMRVSFAAAMRDQFDAYLWVNDDSIFCPDALSRLIACLKAVSACEAPPIIVGSMRDPQTGARSYGGICLRRRGLTLQLDPVIPDDARPLRCDTMNGNLVLIPASVAAALENLDPGFTHQWGDLDYGLRAGKSGIPVFIAPGYFGECTDNSIANTWRDRSLPRSRRWSHLMSPKGAPPREWLRFTSRHFGWRWPFYAVSPYIKTLFS